MIKMSPSNMHLMVAVAVCAALSTSVIILKTSRNTSRLDSMMSQRAMIAPNSIKLDRQGRELLSVDFSDVPEQQRGKVYEALLDRLSDDYYDATVGFAPLKLTGLNPGSILITATLHKRDVSYAMLLIHPSWPDPFSARAVVRWHSWIGQPESGYTLLQGGDRRFDDFIDEVFAPTIRARFEMLLTTQLPEASTDPAAQFPRLHVRVVKKPVVIRTAPAEDG